MSDTTVSLNDICNYITNVAANHATRTSRAHNTATGQSHEQIAFVLRRVVEELQSQFGGGTALPVTQPNQTYRNRATT